MYVFGDELKWSSSIVGDFDILACLILWIWNFGHVGGAAIAVICPLFVGEGEILDAQNKRVATIFDVSTPEELEQLRPEDENAENIVVNLLDWQVCFKLL